MWVSVCLALYVAFKLELNNAYWAGTTAALMCQPHLGASLRKGWFRMLGTIIGAVMIVALTALFPQDRAAFLLSLALWCSACALVATLLRNFASYSAALAGFTAAIIATDQLGSVGGLNGDAFMLAIFRTSEIIIGIVCAGVVLAATDFGGARRRLAALLADLTTDIANGLTATLQAGPDNFSSQPIRRDLTRRVIALDPVIDEAIGESAGIRYHSSILRATVDGLFSALASWRGLATRLTSMDRASARNEADAILAKIPAVLREPQQQDEPGRWMSDPVRLRNSYESMAQTLAEEKVTSPSTRLITDQTAKAFSGIARSLDGLALLLADPLRPKADTRRLHVAVPDWLPGIINAARAFVAIVAVEIFWIVTAWPSGSAAITWVAISVILFAPRADEAYSFALLFMMGCVVSAVIASVFAFAILPQVVTFPAFCAVLGLYLVPAGALMVRWQSVFVIALVANFLPLLAPANEMTYDTVQFYNNALAILVGTGTAAFFFRVLPPLSPATRTRRLLTLTLRDLRRLAQIPHAINLEDWDAHLYARLVVMPPSAEPLERAQLLAALSVGEEIIQLRWFAHEFEANEDVDQALEGLLRGDLATTQQQLSALDERLASMPSEGGSDETILRARSNILAISEALTRHASYFGSTP